MKFLLCLLLIFLSSNMQVSAQGKSPGFTQKKPLVVDLTTKKILLPKELPGAEIVIKNKDGDLPVELPDNVVIERENNKKNNSVEAYPEDMKDLLSTEGKNLKTNGKESVVIKTTSEHNNKGFIMFIYFLLAVIIVGGIIIYSIKNMKKGIPEKI